MFMLRFIGELIEEFGFTWDDPVGTICKDWDAKPAPIIAFEFLSSKGDDIDESPRLFDILFWHFEIYNSAFLI